MANFTEAFQLTLTHEVGYVDDPNYRDGETYRGISRVHHPSWSGWAKIETHKEKRDFPATLDEDRGLQNSVKSFYKGNYWDQFLGDQIPDQQVANELYETGVNMGVRRGVCFLQNALNLLNGNQRYYIDLVVDGWLGLSTLAILENYLKLDKMPDTLLKIMKIQRGARYIEILQNNPAMEKYVRIWLNRI